MMNEKERLFDKEKKSFVITQNLRGNTIPEWVEQYKANEKYRQNRRKNQIYYTHEILSFHKDDVKNISVEKLEDIARKYIEERNPRGLYVAVAHFNKDQEVFVSWSKTKKGRRSLGLTQELKPSLVVELVALVLIELLISQNKILPRILTSFRSGNNMIHGGLFLGKLLAGVLTHTGISFVDGGRGEAWSFPWHR